jgi:Flp pilus assembly protein TadG
MNYLYTKTVKKILRDCRGSLTIEFAILFPVLFLLLVGGLDLGMVVIERMQVEFVTEAAAKCFANANSNPNPNPNLPCTTASATADYAAGHLSPGWGISAAQFTVKQTASDGCVSASYAYTPMILPTGLFSSFGTGWLCYPIT